MTIEQIQAAIDAKSADAREIINMIADYLQSNPGGGGLTLYSGDGTLTGDRVVNLGGHILQFQQGGTPFLNIDPTVNNEFVQVLAYNTTGSGNLAQVYGLTTNTTTQAVLQAAFNNVKSADINASADAISATLTYQAEKHTFNGVMNLAISANASPSDGDVWREDNTNTGLKVRINGVTKTITVT